MWTKSIELTKWCAIVHGMIVAEVWKDKEGLGWVTWWRFCAWSNPDSPGFCSVAILALFTTSLRFTFWIPETGYHEVNNFKNEAQK